MLDLKGRTQKQTSMDWKLDNPLEMY